MRLAISIAAVAATISMSPAAFAQETALNHLDCRYDNAAKTLKCPDILTGRASTSGRPVETASTEQRTQGSAEWNAACAAKYKSFDPDTGMYKSFSGQMRPCV
jgi:hypothetical protein